jgi:hypothetical protein
MSNFKTELRALWYLVKYALGVLAFIAMVWLVGFIDVMVFG